MSQPCGDAGATCRRRTVGMRRKGSHAVSAGRVESQPEPPPPPGPRSAGRGLTLRNYCVLAAAWASTSDPLYLWNDCSARFTVVDSAPPPQPVVTVTSVSPTGASVIELMNEPHGLAMGADGWRDACQRSDCRRTGTPNAGKRPRRWLNPRAAGLGVSVAWESSNWHPWGDALAPAMRAAFTPACVPRTR